MTRRDHFVFLSVAAVIAFIVVYGWVQQPGYTDAFYYINAANRLVSGDGLTDPYLWNYIGAPDTLPTPSHMYWMPMASLVAALGMWLFRAPELYWAAQVPFALMLIGIGYTAFWLGAYRGGTLRHAWASGLIVLLGGFFSRFWGVVETFTPFALLGAGCLVALGQGTNSKHWGWFALAGLAAAGAHLTRADGVLLVVAGLAAIIWFWDVNWNWRQRIVACFVLICAYLLAMSPWLLRNLALIGSPLPIGGTQGIWFTEYNDIFSYPPDSSLQTFLSAGGWRLFWETRWIATPTIWGTFIMVEGLVIMFPLMLIALFKRIHEPFLRPFWIYALGLHLAMWLVFPFPGYRGGLFHSAAALMPFWAALAVIGIDDVVIWIASHRKRYNLRQAKRVYTVGLVFVVFLISVLVASQSPFWQKESVLHTKLNMILPESSRVMVNDPSQFYYFTGLGGVVLPNEMPDILPEIAARYDIDYLLLEHVDEDGIAHAAADGLAGIPQNLPPFLIPVEFDDSTVRLYRFDLAE